ncbi:MAG: hypothetical protein ABFR53_04395, partial [Actinomycetota bacterium]
MMSRRITLPALLLAGALVVSACSAGSSETDPSGTTGSTTSSEDTSATSDTAGESEGADTTAPPEPTTTTVEQEPAITGADLVEQLTPMSGGGTRPLLEWIAVDGA